LLTNKIGSAFYDIRRGNSSKTPHLGRYGASHSGWFYCDTMSKERFGRKEYI